MKINVEIYFPGWRRRICELPLTHQYCIIKIEKNPNKLFFNDLYLFALRLSPMRKILQNGKTDQKSHFICCTWPVFCFGIVKRIEIVRAHLLMVGEQLVGCCCSSLLPVVHLLFLWFSFRLLVSLIVTSRPYPRQSARFKSLGNLQTNNPLFFLSYIPCHYDEEPLSQFSRAFTTGGQRVSEKEAKPTAALYEAFLAYRTNSLGRKKRKEVSFESRRRQIGVSFYFSPGESPHALFTYT